MVMVASSSIALTQSPFYYLNRHVMFIGIGVVLAAVAMRVEAREVEKYNQLLLLGCFALLAVVFIPGLGVTINGARRWINLGVSRFQTVEAVKVLYIIWLSSYLVRFRDEVNATWLAMLKPVGVVGGLVLLLLVQPDFGSSTLLLGITICMLVLGGAQMKRICCRQWCCCCCWRCWCTSSLTACAASPRSWTRGKTRRVRATGCPMP